MRRSKGGAVFAIASALVILLAAGAIVSAQEIPAPQPGMGSPTAATPGIVAPGTPVGTPTAQRPVGQDQVQDLLDEMNDFQGRLDSLTGGGILGLGGRDARPSDLTGLGSQFETLLYGFRQLAPQMREDQREDALETLDEIVSTMVDVLDNYVDSRATATPSATATPGAMTTPGTALAPTATATSGGMAIPGFGGTPQPTTGAPGTPGVAGTPAPVPTVSVQQLTQQIQQARGAQPTAQSLSTALQELQQATATMRQQADQLSASQLETLLDEMIETIDQLAQPVEEFAREAYTPTQATPGATPRATSGPGMPNATPTPPGR